MGQTTTQARITVSLGTQIAVSLGFLGVSGFLALITYSFSTSNSNTASTNNTNQTVAQKSQYDVNGDGSVNYRDGIAMARIVFGLPNDDLNADGVVNELDLIVWLYKYFGFPTPPPPSVLQNCPSNFTDVDCTSEGAGGGDTLNQAYFDALGRCAADFTSCVTSQDQERSNNQGTCESQPNCKFSSSPNQVACAIQECVNYKSDADYRYDGSDLRRTSDGSGIMIVGEPEVEYYPEPIPVRQRWSCWARGRYDQDAYQCQWNGSQ